MTGKKSETCLLCVNEGDVKLTPPPPGEERRGGAGTHHTRSVLMMWGSCRKHSNADKANMFSAFYKLLILFRCLSLGCSREIFLCIMKVLLTIVFLI